MLKSWTASDIRNLEKGAREATARADAAEAKAEALTYEVIATSADAAQQQKRAEAAEAEVERWRLEVRDTAKAANLLNAELKAEVARLRAMIAASAQLSTRIANDCFSTDYSGQDAAGG